ncbi:MAG: hypothetical protein IH600_08450 [Bacteroidetes bacterium]|nr:hypothetical protein [Bacteroidota bacterium]
MILAHPLDAQQESIANDSTGTVQTASPSEFPFPAIIQLHTGATLTGALIDVDSTIVRLDSGGTPIAIPFPGIHHIILPARNNAVSVAVHSMVIGSWLGNLLAMTRPAQPGSYVETFRDDPSPLLFSTVLIAAATGGLGYLIGLAAEREEERFSFAGGNDMMLRAEQQRLARYVHPSPSRPTLHVTVEMAEVHPVEDHKLRALLYSAGYEPQSRYEAWEGYADSPFTLFRKVQATYTVMPGLAMGAAYMDLAEPEPREFTGADDGYFRYLLDLEHQATGWYFVATYEPLRKQLRKPVAWLMGAGIGAVSLRGQLTLTTTQWFGPDFSIDTRQLRSLDGRRFSAIMFTDFRVHLYPSLSLGLTGEYIYLPTVRTALLNGFSSIEPTFNYSSWSWGLAIGVHF